MLTRGILPAGNVKMAVFDCLLGVNVKELDKLAHGTASAADDDTELVIMMIGLGGIIATILVPQSDAAAAKASLDARIDARK